MIARALFSKVRMLVRRSLHQIPIVTTVLSATDAYMAWVKACGGF